MKKDRVIPVFFLLKKMLLLQQRHLPVKYLSFAEIEESARIGNHSPTCVRGGFGYKSYPVHQCQSYFVLLRSNRVGTNTKKSSYNCPQQLLQSGLEALL